MKIQAYLFSFGLSTFLGLGIFPFAAKAQMIQPCLEEGKTSTSLEPSLETLAALNLQEKTKGPKGKLKVDLSKSVDGGSMDGKWAVDEAGEEWFIKTDPAKHPELQTSAEVISSRIYEFLGYPVPYTVIVEINGRRFSAAKKIKLGKRTRLLQDAPNTPMFRQLKIFAAYLSDKDRLGDGTNNFRYGEDGSYALFDFGGSLGSKSQGEHKVNKDVKLGIDFPSFSKATGSFPATDNWTVLWDWYGYDPKDEVRGKWLRDMDHPWGKITEEDFAEAAAKMALLTDAKIDEIVKEAKYSSLDDTKYIADALKARRDGFIKHIEKIKK